MILLNPPGIPHWGLHVYYKTRAHKPFGLYWEWDWYTEVYSQGGLKQPISPYW